MKRLLFLVSIFVLFGSVSAFAQQQEPLSDYEIQKNFKEQYQHFKQRIDTVVVADTARAIIARIDSLDQQYQPHAELLDKALYPDTYEQRIRELKQGARQLAGRLQKMARQDEKLTTLQLRLLAYQEHVSYLNDDVDSLRQAMQASIESEKQLSGMVRNYRQNLEERDELILAFIDSTVVAYRQLDLQALKSLEDVNSQQQISSDGNALEMIRSISAENLNILQNNSSKLRLSDYMRMHTVQQRFENMWNQLGSKITEVYGGNDADEMARQISRNIDQWDQLLKKKTYATLSDSLKAKGLDIGTFNNGEELYSSLNAYLENEIKQSKQGASKANYQHYQAFREFWNKVEHGWETDFASAEIMTSDQMAAIATKTETWSQYAKPESNTMMYLLAGAVFLILLLGGLLIREKNSSKSQSAKG